MKCVADIFDALGGNSTVARGIGQKPSAVSEMRRRNSIPVQHWPSLLSFAANAGVDLTSDMLMALHVRSAA